MSQLVLLCSSGKDVTLLIPPALHMDCWFCHWFSKPCSVCCSVALSALSTLPQYARRWSTKAEVLPRLSFAHSSSIKVEQDYRAVFVLEQLSGSCDSCANLHAGKHAPKSLAEQTEQTRKMTEKTAIIRIVNCPPLLLMEYQWLLFRNVVRIHHACTG